eukprot:360224-Chlamydomonas_euryale.AAC.6
MAVGCVFVRVAAGLSAAPYTQQVGGLDTAAAVRFRAASGRRCVAACVWAGAAPRAAADRGGTAIRQGSVSARRPPLCSASRGRGMCMRDPLVCETPRRSRVVRCPPPGAPRRSGGNRQRVRGARACSRKPPKCLLRPSRPLVIGRSSLPCGRSRHMVPCVCLSATLLKQQTRHQPRAPAPATPRANSLTVFLFFFLFLSLSRLSSATAAADATKRLGGSPHPSVWGPAAGARRPLWARSLGLRSHHSQRIASVIAPSSMPPLLVGHNERVKRRNSGQGKGENGQGQDGERERDGREERTRRSTATAGGGLVAGRCEGSRCWVDWTQPILQGCHKLLQN